MKKILFSLLVTIVFLNPTISFGQCWKFMSITPHSSSCNGSNNGYIEMNYAPEYPSNNFFQTIISLNGKTIKETQNQGISGIQYEFNLGPGTYKVLINMIII